MMLILGHEFGHNNLLTQTGEKAASGIYFYVLKSGKFSASRKMVLIRYPERD